jgi:predicted NAD/FAD-binding protein
LVCAYLLARRHELVIFEADDRVGGHVDTHSLTAGGRSFRVDSGFIVHNDRTYPHFIKLLAELGVGRVATEMSFSVRNDAANLEYNGHTLATLFAQRRNLLRPRFLRMLGDIVRFNAAVKRELPALTDEETLDGYVERSGYGAEFREHYLTPMVAAIWSAGTGSAGAIPVRLFGEFFANHGLLDVSNRPQWRTVEGGAARYVDALLDRGKLRSAVRLSSPVTAISRSARGVTVTARGGRPEEFDHVVIAAHSDDALRLLTDPSDREREVLGAIPYVQSEAVVHTDQGLLPRRRAARASWNYLMLGDDAKPTLTYDMNILQRLDSSERFCVTLNAGERVEGARLLKKRSYRHPVYDPKSVAARRRRVEICGVARTHFCGAYWGYGFHEDGVVSALEVAERFGERL